MKIDSYPSAVQYVDSFMITVSFQEQGSAKGSSFIHSFIFQASNGTMGRVL